MQRSHLDYYDFDPIVDNERRKPLVLLWDGRDEPPEALLKKGWKGEEMRRLHSLEPLPEYQEATIFELRPEDLLIKRFKKVTVAVKQAVALATTDFSSVRAAARYLDIDDTYVQTLRDGGRAVAEKDQPDRPAPVQATSPDCDDD